jgi:clan AA aspartic protease
MIGRVDNAWRALVDVELRRTLDSASSSVAVWIDTGFTGDLVLPQSMIDDMALAQSGTVSATLADGSRTVLATYECYILWFDEWKRLEVVANQGTNPLLGVGLLLGRALTIDFRTRHLTLE